MPKFEKPSEVRERVEYQTTASQYFDKEVYYDDGGSSGLVGGSLSV